MRPASEVIRIDPETSICPPSIAATAVDLQAIGRDLQRVDPTARVEAVRRVLKATVAAFFKGKSRGSHRFSCQIWGFPVSRKLSIQPIPGCKGSSDILSSSHYHIADQCHTVYVYGN